MQLPTRNDPDRLLGHEEAFVRALIEKPKLTYAQAWAIARGLPPERATNGMRSAASQAMQRPRVQKYLAEQRAAVSAKAKEEIAYDRVAALRDLLEVKSRCMEAVPLLDKFGRPTGSWTFNAAGALRALELIGRELGMFVDRKEVRAGPLQDVSDEELDGIIAESATQAEVAIGLSTNSSAHAKTSGTLRPFRLPDEPSAIPGRPQSPGGCSCGYGVTVR